MDSHLKENIERVQNVLNTCGNTLIWQRAILDELMRGLNKKRDADRIAIQAIINSCPGEYADDENVPCKGEN